MSDQVAATLKLDNLLQQPETKIETLPTGGVKVGDNRTWLRRVYESWVMRIQAIGGVLVTLWLTIPQETMMDVVPAEYQKVGVLIYIVLTTLARMRSL